MKNNVTQEIAGNNNIQVAGDLIRTEKVVRKVLATPDYSIHISDAQAKQIKNKIDTIVSSSVQDKDEQPKAYRDIYARLKKEFNATSYKFIPKEKFDVVITYLNRLNAYKYRNKARRTNNDSYRSQMYAAIHARARNIGMSNEQLYMFINEVLLPSKQITSMRELSDTRLKKIYQKIFSKK
jgi:hypothetical protein